MTEKVELVFEREKSKEKPEELIVRYLSTQMLDTKDECEVYPQGYIMPDDHWGKEKIYGVYHKTFFLAKQNLWTLRPGGGFHVLDYRQVDHEFFEFCKYPDPGPLWDLLDTLKRRTEKGRRFTGPPHLRRFVRNLTGSMREDFQFKSDPEAWQAAICCKCACEIFDIRYLGELHPDGLLGDTEDEVQRTELICKDCGRIILLFDPMLHGYNAVICEIWPTPIGPRKTTHEYLCSCGIPTFRVAVLAFYDTDPETVAEMPARQRNDSYGWFISSIKCVSCDRLIRLVDYECA